MEFTKLDISNKITQSNDLVTAQYKLSLNEQKIILCLISLIQPNDTEFKKYKLMVRDLMDVLDTKNKQFYNEIKEITGSLLKKTINFTSPQSILQINWFSSAEYFKNKGYVELSIDPKLRPYLLNLKDNFLSYDFGVAVKFRSTYTIRLFQLLLANYRKYKKKELTFSLEYLRELFQVDKNEYVLYSNFKARILEPAKKELEEKHKNFYFRYNQVKLARKVVNIEFILIAGEKKPTKNTKINKTSFSEEISKWIPSEKIINGFFEQYGIEVVENNFKYFKTQLEKGKIKDKENPTSFLIKAIENNYAGNLPKKDLIKSKQELLREQEKLQEEEEIKAAERRKKFELHLKELFKVRFQSLSDDKKKILEYDFIQHLNSTNHGKNVFKKIKTNGFTDTFLEFYLFNKQKVLSKSEMDFEVWDRTQTLF